MSNSYAQLIDVVEALQAKGVEVKVTKLPSAAKRQRKSILGVKKVRQPRQKVSA